MPYMAVVIVALTRPSSACGVTAWRKVVWVMNQRIGPKPNRKKASASAGQPSAGGASAMASAPRSETAGPKTSSAPVGRRAISQAPESAAAMAPAP